MKRLGLFSIALLAGCVPTQKEYTIIRETSRPVVQVEDKNIPTLPEAVETKTVAPTPAAPVTTSTQTTTPCPHMTTDGKPACLQPAPTYFAGTYNQPQGVYQTQQHIAYQSGGCGGQIMCGQNLTSTLGGNIMNMPIQNMQTAPAQIQIPTSVQMPTQTQPQSTVMIPVAMPAPQMLQTEVYYETQTVPMNAQIMAQMPASVQAQLTNVSEVVLQHPTNRDLVKCTYGDVNCMTVYQTQGYIPLQNTPIAPSYNATLPNTPYAVSSTWQDNTNIPRW